MRSLEVRKVDGASIADGPIRSALQAVGFVDGYRGRTSALTPDAAVRAIEPPRATYHGDDRLLWRRVVVNELSLTSSSTSRPLAAIGAPWSRGGPAVLDLVGAVLARRYADHRSVLALVGGCLVFGLLFWVYGKSLAYGERGHPSRSRRGDWIRCRSASCSSTGSNSATRSRPTGSRSWERSCCCRAT